MARQSGSTLLSKVSPLFTAFGLIVLGLAASAIFADSASAHGYIESPASRAYQCKLGMNTNCGQVQYEPQSVEAKGNFPVSGPADGHIAGGGIFARSMSSRPIGGTKSKCKAERIRSNGI